MKNKKLRNITLAAVIGAVAFGAGVYALNGDFTAKAETVNSATDAVELTIGETTTGYASFEEALTASNGAEYAEIKLLMDTQGADMWVQTNLTLDLNGFTLENTCLSTDDDFEYSSLTIVDYSFALTGKVTGVSGMGWTFYAGNNTIYDGQFDENVGFHVGGDDTTLDIYGGKFEFLSAQAEDNGKLKLQNFEADELRFGTRTDGTVDLLGGSFGYWYQSEGVIADWLPDGYKIFDAYDLAVDANTQRLFVEDGQYYQIKEHSECYYDNYAHTKTEHWQGCTCGATENGAEPVKEEHTWENGNCFVCYINHEHESLDENGYCSVCEWQMSIQVIDGENVTFYNNLADAVSKMPENAILKLLTSGGTWGKNLYITKPMTLDLNGNMIESASSEDIYVYAPITIMDSVGTGVVFPGLILESMAVIKGGNYNYIEVKVEDKTYSDFLGAGYHYYDNDATVGEGQPLTDEQIAENVQNYKGVKVLCDCSHTGGTATCQEKAACEICGNAYGELGGHADKDNNEKCDTCRTAMPNPNKEGCSGAIGGGTALAMISAAAVAVVLRKRKEN